MFSFEAPLTSAWISVQGYVSTLSLRTIIKSTISFNFVYTVVILYFSIPSLPLVLETSLRYVRVLASDRMQQRPNRFRQEETSH